MTVIEFLSDYAELFLKRAQNERIPDITCLYNEDIDNNAYVHIGNGNGGLDIIVGFPLLMEMKDAYKPELTEEQWGLFLENLKP